MYHSKRQRRGSIYYESTMTRMEIICEEIVLQKIVIFEDMEYGQEGKHMGKHGRLFRYFHYMRIMVYILTITDYIAVA